MEVKSLFPLLCVSIAAISSAEGVRGEEKVYSLQLSRSHSGHDEHKRDESNEKLLSF